MKTKSEELRNKILIAATDIILDEGIANTSTIKVAKKIGGSQSNIYSYYSNKQSLLLAVFEYHQLKMIDAIGKNVEMTATKKNLIKISKALLEFSKNNSKSIQLISSFRSQPSIRYILPRIEDNETLDKMFKIFIQSQEEGIIKDIPIEFLMENIFSVFVNYINAKIAKESYISDLSDKEIIKVIKNIAFN